MSYCIAIPNTSTKPNPKFIPATQLTNGMTINVAIDRQNGDDGDGTFERKCTVTNLKVSKTGKYIHFELDEVSTDELCEVVATHWVEAY